MKKFMKGAAITGGIFFLIGLVVLLIGIGGGGIRSAGLFRNPGWKPSHCLSSVYRANRSGKNRTVPGIGGGSLRKQGSYDPAGYDGVYGKTVGFQADRRASRLCGL